MAIVKMSKFSLFAFDSEREDLLHELQKFKYVHFLDQEENESLKDEGLKNISVSEKVVAINEEITKVRYGIDLLSKYFERDSGIKAMQKGKENFDFMSFEKKAKEIDYLPLYAQLRELNTKKEALNQEASKLNTLVDELTPWTKLNTSIKSLNSFRQTEVNMGTVPKKLKEKLQSDLLSTQYTYLEILSEDKDNLYILALYSKSEEEMVEEILRNNSFTKARLSIEGRPIEEITRLNKELNAIEEDLRSLENEIKGLSNNLPDLELVYDYLMNKKLRIASSEKFLMTENVNVIKGYVPEKMITEFTEKIKKVLGKVYYLDIKEAELDDPEVPTLLENSKFAKSFESLTGMYALPKYNEIDPTPLLAPFYLIFFGMMAADVAYGLIMLIGTVFVLKTFNLSESMKQSIKFFFYLSFSVIFWGFLYGSFFSGIIPLPGLFDPAVDYNSLLILSIIFGLIHIFFALGISAYINIRDGRVKDAIFDVGFWYMALIGAIVYLLGMVVTLPSVARTIAMVVMVLGMLGIVATGGRDAQSIGGKIGGGIYELYGISGYVGDFVSYSRLMALGLSGGFIAGAVNMMAGMLVNKGIIGIIGAVIIFIGGQMFNLGLSLLGAYVHTIRLTFVEFFGKFYEGGGKDFDLFISKPKYVNLK